MHSTPHTYSRVAPDLANTKTRPAHRHDESATPRQLSIREKDDPRAAHGRTAGSGKVAHQDVHAHVQQLSMKIFGFWPSSPAVCAVPGWGGGWTDEHVWVLTVCSVIDLVHRQPDTLAFWQMASHGPPSTSNPIDTVRGSAKPAISDRPPRKVTSNMTTRRSEQKNDSRHNATRSGE